jgi:8-oxo-dGTP diphosphatase
MLHRISARGYLEKDNKVLFIEYKDEFGIFYALPGGRQEVSEFLAETLVREFKEEVCLDVEPLEVIMVREFTKETAEFEPWRNGIHQVEVIFRCRMVDEVQIASDGHIPDPGSRGLKWIDKADFNKYRIYPIQELVAEIETPNFSYLVSRD